MSSSAFWVSQPNLYEKPEQPPLSTLTLDGATVLLDPVTVEYMAGAQIDFVADLMHQAFKITNPLATASCGCGTSFAM
jgi:iron-sulfur cluster assembly accessory protein